MASSPWIEIRVEGVDGLVSAQRAGADRVKLCAGLIEGGLTPSGMTFRNPHVGMGGDDRDREYRLTLTDEAAVRSTIAAARGQAA